MPRRSAFSSQIKAVGFVGLQRDIKQCVTSGLTIEPWGTPTEAHVLAVSTGEVLSGRKGR